MKFKLKTVLGICALLLAVCMVCLAENADGSGDMRSALPVFTGESYIIELGNHEKEWFAFKADQDNAFYRFTSKNQELGTSVYMELFDANGISIKKVDYSKGNTGFISYKLNPDETYYICFSRYMQKYTGRVTMTIEKTPDVYGDNLENAHPIALDETVITTFDGTGDEDWFVFTTDEGSAFYRADFKNESVETTVYMELLDKNGLSLQKKDKSKNGSDYYSFKAEPNETYYLRFYRYSLDKTGKYTFTLTKTEDAHGDAPESASPIELNKPVHGSFDGTGDIDVFVFTAEEGSAYYEAALKNEDIATNTYIEVTDTNDLSLYKEEALKGKEKTISWKVNSGETYYLKITRYDKVKTGKYVVELTKTPDNEPDTFGDARSLMVNERVDASFDGKGDVDVFVLTMGENDAYIRADFKNEDVNSTLYLEIFDEYENAFEKTDASKGKESFISFKAIAEKTYYFKFHRYDKNHTGRYYFTITRTPDNEPDDLDSALVIAANEDMKASFDGTGDEDWFAIESAQGNVFYELRFKNENVKSTLYAEVYDENGFSLFKGDASTGKEGSVKWNALDADGRYIRFTRYDKKHLGEYTFTLIEKNDVGGNDPQTALELVSGEEAIVTKDQEKDVDYIAFPDENACIMVVNRDEKYAYVRLVDAYGMEIGEESRIRRGESARFENENKDVFVRVRTEGDQVYAYCCLEGLHTPGDDWQIITYADCETEGLKVLNCVVCGKPAQEEKTEKAEHEAGEWTVMRKADCEENGYEARLCVNCGSETERREIVSYGHEYGRWIIEIEPGCEAEGLQRQFCTLCGKLVKMEKISSFGHVAGKWETVGSKDCESDTVKTRACQVCGEILEKEIVKASGHEKSEPEVLSESSCNQDGVTVVICRNCGKVLEEIRTPASGHRFGEWTVSKEPTFSEEGIEERTCADCGETEQKTIAQKSIKDSLFGK